MSKKPDSADDSLDFTNSGSSKARVQPRKKKTPGSDGVKAGSSRRVGAPVLIVIAIIVVVVFVVAQRSSKEVVTPPPSAKPSAPSQPRPQASRPPQTAAPYPAPAPPPQASAPSSQSSTPPGKHRRAMPAEFRKALLEYASKTGGKAIALALDNDGKWAFGSVSGFSTEAEASAEALSDCARYKAQAGVEENCRLYAVGDNIVW